MSVCLSARISQNPQVQIPPNFLYVLHVAVARSFSDFIAIYYVLPVLWMTTSCFHKIEQMARIRDDGYVSSSSPDGCTEGKVCRLQLQLVFSDKRCHIFLASGLQSSFCVPCILY